MKSTRLTHKIKLGAYSAATFASTLLYTAPAYAAEVDEQLNNIEGSNPADEGLIGIFQNIIDAIIGIVAAISVLMLVIGGIRYVVSGGDQNAVQNAKNTILYAIIGLVVAFVSFAAVRFVVDQLEG